MLKTFFNSNHCYYVTLQNILIRVKSLILKPSINSDIKFTLSLEMFNLQSMNLKLVWK